MKRLSLFILVCVMGCAEKKSPPPSRNFASDLELQMYADQLHQETMDRVYTKQSTNSATWERMRLENQRNMRNSYPR